MKNCYLGNDQSQRKVLIRINELFHFKDYPICMKKRFYLLLLLPFLVFSLGIFSAIQSVQAKENTDSVVYLSRTEVVNSDYFVVGNTVIVSGTIQGDAYIAGGNVTFDGVVDGDLLVAGGNVTILGKVTGDVRAAGGNVVFSSQVDKNATLVGGSISLSDSGKILGSLVSAGGNLSINSPVGKGATIAGGQISLGNSIGSNVNVYSENLLVSSRTKIIGDLNYWSGKEQLFNPEASISGKTNYHYVQAPQYENTRVKEQVDSGKIFGFASAGMIAFQLFSFVMSLLIGFIYITALPVESKKTVKTLETRVWASLGIGFLISALFPMVFILLLITIIGIPVAIAFLMGMILLWFISEIVVALYLGSRLLFYFGKNGNSSNWSLFVGLALIHLLSLIPVINIFAGVFVYLIGTGASIMQMKNTYSLLRQKQLI